MRFSLDRRFNRVEGLLVGPSVTVRAGWGIRLRLKAGYGFAAQRGAYQVSVERRGRGRYGYTAGFEAHDLVDTSDRWIVSDEESTALAFLFGVAARDYIARSGYRIYLEWWMGKMGLLRAAYGSDAYSTLAKHTDWSFFRRNHRKRENWEIGEVILQPDEGDLRSMTFSWVFNPNLVVRGRSGWYCAFLYEQAGGRFGGDFAFRQHQIDIQRRNRISRNQWLNFRVIVGLNSGEAPRQKRFYLGGIGTLPGYDYKTFWGDRLLLVKGEYRIGARKWTIIGFADGGSTWPEDAPFDLGDLHYDAGVGLELERLGRVVRVDFSHPLNSEEGGKWVANLRLGWSF